MVDRTNYIIPILAMLFCALNCNKFEDGHKTNCFPPYIDFKVKVDSASQIVTIDSIVKLNGPFNKFNWDFGDGRQLNNIERPSSHSYPNKTVDTTYDIKLTVSNNCQEISTWYKSVLIKGCLIAAEFDTIINRDRVTFINKTNPGLKRVEKYLWNFGDGTSDTAKNPITHIYSTPGIKNVSLLVSSSCGDNIQKKVITIECYKEVICNDCIIITDKTWSSKLFSLQSYNGINSVEWDFGDNSSKIKGFTSSHTFLNEDSYTITATITNECKSREFYKPLIIIKPKDEFMTLDIPSLSQSDDYRQIVYFKNRVYVLNSRGYFYEYNPVSNLSNRLDNSQILIDNNVRLKKDSYGNSLWNFGTNGLRLYNEGSWVNQKNDLKEFITSKVNDIDCNENKECVYMEKLHYCVVYNTFRHLFYFIDNPNKKIMYGMHNSSFLPSPLFSEIDNNSLEIIHNSQNGDMFFINSLGVVQVDYKFSIKNKFYNSSISDIISLPKKILLSKDLYIFSLLENGSLIKFNINTNSSSVIWPNGLKDFDIFTNTKGETEIFICGNGILKHLVKN